VNELKNPTLLDAAGIPPQAGSALLAYFKFCELGAVSPDYPAMTLLDPSARPWADNMHGVRTGDVIKEGVERVKALQGEKQRKCVAWLLGYAAHVVADVIVHPVVILKVGYYDNNPLGHRVCEMNEDTWLFDTKMNLGGLGLSAYLDSHIGQCCQPSHKNRLDADVKEIWGFMLKKAYPVDWSQNAPNMDQWHKNFKKIVGSIASNGDKLWPMARHVTDGLGITYPEPNQVDQQYIVGLKVPVPAGTAQPYNTIFDRVAASTLPVWKLIAEGVFKSSTQYLVSIGNWSLNNGQDQNGKLVFWEVTV
jgi:hypothetical protein